MFHGFLRPLLQVNSFEIARAFKHGCLARLYVVVPTARVLDGRAKAILASHLDVPAWSEREFGGGVVYYPRDQEMLPTTGTSS